jgi:hypothetical protein
MTVFQNLQRLIMIQKTNNSATSLLTYDSKERIIVCISCRFAVPPLLQVFMLVIPRVTDSSDLFIPFLPYIPLQLMQTKNAEQSLGKQPD